MIDTISLLIILFKNLRNPARQVAEASAGQGTHPAAILCQLDIIGVYPAGSRNLRLGDALGESGHGRRKIFARAAAVGDCSDRRAQVVRRKAGHLGSPLARPLNCLAQNIRHLVFVYMPVPASGGEHEAAFENMAMAMKREFPNAHDACDYIGHALDVPATAGMGIPPIPFDLQIQSHFSKRLVFSQFV